jgi:hypothetical protein
MPRRKEPTNGLYLRSGGLEGAAFGWFGIIALVGIFAVYGMFTLGGFVSLGSKLLLP